MVNKNSNPLSTLVQTQQNNSNSNTVTQKCCTADIQSFGFIKAFLSSSNREHQVAALSVRPSVFSFPEHDPDTTVGIIKSMCMQIYLIEYKCSANENISTLPNFGVTALISLFNFKHVHNITEIKFINLIVLMLQLGYRKKSFLLPFSSRN